MSTPQEYWDACLLRTWRNIGTISDANKMFYSILGKWPSEIEPRLLRLPNFGLPFTIQARYFVAHFMPKLNEMLHKSDKDKDVEVLRKLKNSKYNTAKKADVSVADAERFKNEGKRMKIDKMVMDIEKNNYKTRNSATDWNVVKGPTKIRARRK